MLTCGPTRVRRQHGGGGPSAVAYAIRWSPASGRGIGLGMAEKDENPDDSWASVTSAGMRSAGSLRAVMQELIEVVGPLLERIKRKPQHRLNKLLADAEQAITFLTTFNGTTVAEGAMSLVSLTELMHHSVLLEDARKELSGWSDLMAQCSGPDFYEHFILTLAVQHTMRKNWGLQAQLIPELEDMKTPDLMVYQDGQAIAVEVKSKEKLMDPEQLLPYEEAQRIIKTAMSSIGSSEKGQLVRGRPSVLAIGGFFITEAQIEMLKKAALEWFKRNPGRRKSLMGIMVLSLTAYSKGPRVGPEGFVPTASLYVEFAFNPSYNLATRFTFERRSDGGIITPAEFRRWKPDFTITKE